LRRRSRDLVHQINRMKDGDEVVEAVGTDRPDRQVQVHLGRDADPYDAGRVARHGADATEPRPLCPGPDLRAAERAAAGKLWWLPRRGTANERNP
jgi:hypothetical protein